MASGDYMKKVSKSRRLFDKVCTACGWKGKGVLQKKKCPECGHLNLKNE